LAACRVLVAVSARSIAAVQDMVDPVQFRALVVIASRRSMSLGELGEAAGLNLSTASRLCDRLVQAELVDRSDDPDNRRQLRLTLTDNGHQLVATVMARRREALALILQRIPTPRRLELVAVLREFASAGGETNERDLWSLGWTNTPEDVVVG
jgi:DNA-binding MarR family transcriptional regulator